MTPDSIFIILIIFTFILLVGLKLSTDPRYNAINRLPMIPNCNTVDERDCRDI